MTIRPLAVALPLLLCPVACVAVEPPAPIDPRTLEQHSARLLRPYQQGHTVYCRTLEVELNANFERLVAYPAGGTRSAGDGFDQIAWNKGDRVKIKAPKNANAAPIAEPTPGKFKVFIGTTVFQVDDAVRVRKLLKAPPTLTATARGHVLLLQNDSSAAKLESIRYADGTVQAKK